MLAGGLEVKMSSRIMGLVIVFRQWKKELIFVVLVKNWLGRVG
jgi:hypothetical protein